MQTLIAVDPNTAGIIELNTAEISHISGGHPAAVAAAAIVALGSSALDFGRNRGATVYRVLH